MSLQHPVHESFSSWLRAARAPYLNFLRNLTPQILLASLAWVIGTKLNFTKLDASNILQTVAFYAFLMLFGFAVYANISLFLAELFPGLMPSVRDKEAALIKGGVTRGRMPLHLFPAVWKERKLELLLAFFAMGMLEFVFAGELVSSIGAAVSFLKTTRG